MYLSKFLLLLCSFFVMELPASVMATESSEKPNIVYILLDDAGYGDLSCYGQTKFETPNMDRMATEGMKFTQHYSGSTVCAPTRCSLMTGKHTGHCVVRGNREVKPEGQAPMPADVVTIPRLLKKAGYTTGMFGKWGLGAPGSTSDPMEHFDVFYGYNCQREAHDYYPDHLWSNNEVVSLDEETYAHDLIMEQSYKFVRDHKDKPFFLFLPVTIPHAAMQVPEDSIAPYREKFPQFEKLQGKYAGRTVTNPVAAFAGMMTRLDSQIGALQQLLRDSGLEENTLIVLTSDNGPHKEGGHNPEFFNSNGPFKGHKRDLYDGGIRTFMLATWKGKIAPGSKSNLISAHWDMLPTFCDVAGVTVPADVDGISMVNELTGHSKEQAKHEYLYWEFSERGRSQAARKGNWKAVRNNLKKNPNAPIELFNINKDRGEENNIAEQHPDVVKEMAAILKKAHVPSETFPLFESEKK